MWLDDYCDYLVSNGIVRVEASITVSILELKQQVEGLKNALGEVNSKLVLSTCAIREGEVKLDRLIAIG